MNKLITLFSFCLLLVAATIVSSCSKNNDPGPDTDAPTVEFANPLKDGSSVYLISVGNNFKYMEMDATFRDNRALSKCEITISYNEDVSSTILKGIGTPWEPAEKKLIHTIEFDGEKEVKIKENLFDKVIEGGCLGGSYTLKIIVADESDNEYKTMIDVTLQ